MGEQGHGGLAVSRALKALGVDKLFTLSGGHIFPIFDGAHQDGIQIVDVRHEQNAVFAAEGWARLTRTLGVAAVTAGPGVTNAMSPMAQAAFNNAPVLVLAGRAPAFRWGQGSLQEMDHPPFVNPIAPARTVQSTDEIAKEVIEAAKDALFPPKGPRFLDFPLDVLFNMTDLDVPEVRDARPIVGGDGEATARLIEQADRPILIAGSNVWLHRGEDALRQLVEGAGIPVFMNGQGRGLIPADHPLAFSRARSKALKEADLVIVAGTPLDFRLGFGEFNPGAKVVHVDAEPARHVELAEDLPGPVNLSLESINESFEGKPQTDDWVQALRAEETAKLDKVQAELHSTANPIHPMRIYGELVPLLDRDAVVIGDGGDFVSYAGKEVPSFEPGCWLDPGPFGCLGVGPPFAIAAKLLHPDHRVLLIAGDGAFGLNGMEMETAVRFGLPITCIIGNDGGWGQIRNPQLSFFGEERAVATSLPTTRFDQMIEALGGRGTLVREPKEIGPALERALSSDDVWCINVPLDPAAYRRTGQVSMAI